MTTYYTIYLVNESADTQTFWCFLAPPEDLASPTSGVYANSSAYLAVRPQSPGINSFTIPVQYMVGAGASNQAVGLGVEINSDVTNNASLQDTWGANYVTVPPQEGPTMMLAGAQAAPNTIAIVSNAFDKGTNEVAHWFSSQSFGIQTEAGFIGMSWSPDPQQTRTLEPLLTFYVATGAFGSNALAAWDDVSNGAAKLSVPDSFSLNAVTVTYTAIGGWLITPGAPPSLGMTQNLEFFRSPAHEELVALANLDKGNVAADVLQSVSWDSADQDETGLTYLSGTVTVATALGAAFTYFILSGVQFTIARPASGVTTFRFTYSGAQGANQVKSLFVAGAQLLLGGAR